MGKSCWSCCCCWSRSCWGVGRAAAAGRWSAETGLAEEAEAAATGAFAATAVVFVVAVTDAGATAGAEAAATFAVAGDGAGAVCFLGEKRERERERRLSFFRLAVFSSGAMRSRFEPILPSPRKAPNESKCVHDSLGRRSSSNSEHEEHKAGEEGREDAAASAASNSRRRHCFFLRRERGIERFRVSLFGKTFLSSSFCLFRVSACNGEHSQCTRESENET